MRKSSGAELSSEAKQGEKKIGPNRELNPGPHTFKAQLEPGKPEA